MSNSIVNVNVSLQVAPTPATLQKTGAFVSYGGTIESPGTSLLLTQLSDLMPYLSLPAAISSVSWSGGVATATTTSAHNMTTGQVILLTIAGFAPTAYNGTYWCTITGSNTFTFPLANNPGSVTTAGTWVNADAAQLVQMATTFFAQGALTAVYVLELGASDVATGIANLSQYLTDNPNSNYTPGATGYFYSYLLPREWDANSALLTLMQSYESPTSRTYFYITSNLQNYVAYNNLEKCGLVFIESPQWGTWLRNSMVACAFSNGVVTASTATAHGVSVGDWFQIAGCVPTGYNGWHKAEVGTTGTTLIWKQTSNPGVISVEGVLIASKYSNAGATSAEFSASAAFYVSLHYDPSTTNKVTPYAFSYVFGVTPFPTRFNNSLLSTLKSANINYIGTGAEGGISNTIILWGTTLDGQQLNYWYSIDWVQINLDLDTANEVINGSNNPINPLYYNQPGIDTIQARAVGTMNRGITYGLVLGEVVATALDGATLDRNLDQGLYADKTVVNAVPFVRYSLDNPSDYKLGKYAGMSVIYMPQQGFINIVYNVVVTQLIAY